MTRAPLPTPVIHSAYSLSVVIPIYNEEVLVAKAVAAIETFLADHFSDYEIIIVESGSTDSTPEICDRLAEKETIRVIHEGARNGFGAAMKLGYDSCTRDLAWLVTVDQPFPLEAILEALPYLETHDAVLSYRSTDPRSSIFRKLQSWVYNHLVRALLAVRVRHVNSAFKLYKTPIIQRIPILTNGWLIDTEIIYWLTRNRIPYAEIPVALIDRKESSSSIGYLEGFRVIKDLIYFLRHRKDEALVE